MSTNYGRNLNNLAGNVDFGPGTMFLPPNAPALFNEDGTSPFGRLGSVGLTNPLEGYFNKTTAQSNNLISNVSLSYGFLPGLQIKTSIGYTYYDATKW